MTLTIKQDRILDNWVTVVDNGAGYSGRVYDKTDMFLAEAQLPGVTWKREDVSTGLLEGLLGKTRDFLVVSHRGLKEYGMYLSSRDYGQHLDCGWFLTVEPRFLKRAISKYAVGSGNGRSLSLDVFDQQDLSAWVSVVHHAFVKSIKEIMEELKQDITGMNTRSKGYLSVW